MEEKTIKIFRSNDLKIITLAGTVFFLIIGLITVFSQLYLISIICFIISVAIVTHGTKTIIDFQTNNIERSPTILFTPLNFNKESYSKDQFNKITLSQFSDFDGAQFRSHSSQIKVREYHLVLTSTHSEIKYKLAVFNDYKYARKIMLQFKENWDYSAIDRIQEKLKSNRAGHHR